MIRVVTLLILAIGCGPSVAPPPLTIVKLEIRDTEFPARVVLTVTNNTRKALPIDAVTLYETGQSLVYDDDYADRVPVGFECRVVLLDGGEPLADFETIDVEPGATVDLVADLDWKLFDETPPIFAIVQSRFSVEYVGDLWERTDMAVFTLQSQPGALELLVNDVGDDRQHDRELSTLLDQHTGVPSPGFATLRARLAGGDVD